jgi:succinyl-CoA synthetase beta subunit
MREVVEKLYKCFRETDSTLVEINPLGIDIEGKIKICDSKVNIDDNSWYRQK